MSNWNDTAIPAATWLRPVAGHWAGERLNAPCESKLTERESGDASPEPESERVGNTDTGSCNVGGPIYRDQQIVIASGAKPTRANKDFAFRSAELASRMSDQPHDLG
jgi:hypothetical protein